jgi:hypothetical protein
MNGARRVPRRLAAAAAVSLMVLVPATPAFGAAADGAESSPEVRPTRSDVRAYGRWSEVQELSVGSLAVADMPLEALREAAERAWAAGVPRRLLQAVLFSDAGRDLLAGNAAAGEGRPSPYLAYFQRHFDQLGPLGEFLLASPAYVAGPGGTQDRLFARFPGLRDSYLASLGLVEVNGRIVDPRMPYLTPSLVSMLMGAPKPLPQPAAS